MTNDLGGEAHLCGRLYAALAELQRLGEGEHHSLGRPGVLKKLALEPSKHLTEHLHLAGKYLLTARNRGQGAPAAVVFRSLPDLLPSGRGLPGSLRDDALQERFHEGRTAQEAAIGRAG
ncbi:hypothetical protein [Streptomyces sp. NBC_00059]|uniref:hypothetical protein n=1 Tax=Streptomyces sp. NBC_00059 TaxID=2975635 RepID=UPI0022586F4D|nr:hypothetical protein [Streptomyces sp. NBC_00059]MCX5412464.1 hypothetical protein [Streptomyces sp. NBC_00059]